MEKKASSKIRTAIKIYLQYKKYLENKLTEVSECGKFN